MLTAENSQRHIDTISSIVLAVYGLGYETCPRHSLRIVCISELKVAFFVQISHGSAVELQVRVERMQGG